MDYQLWKIYWAFRNGDRDLSAELLAMFWTSTTDTNNLNLDSVKGYYGDTLLHLACRNGWLDYIKWLLVEGIGSRRYEPDIEDCGKQTPLHYACHYGHLDVVQYLTEVHSCDVAVATRDHWTPLHYACRYGHLNIVEYILDIPGVTSSRKQLQYYVVYEYDLSGQELVYLRNKKGNPASVVSVSVLLQLACSFGQVQIVQHLCNKYGSHQYLNDTKTRRLFIFCCKYGLLEIITQLRPNVSLPLGRSGLHYACQEGHVSIAEYFIEECGCDINREDRNGYTPLDLACMHSYNCNIDMVKYMFDKLKCPHAWIKALSLIFCNQQWSDSQCIDLIKLLMSTREWKLTSLCNSNGDTLLHLSAKHNRPNVVQFLLLKFDFQIDSNIMNIEGETPLQQASHPEIIKLFIYQKGIKTDNKVVDRLLTGSTQMQESVCVEILKWMIKHGQWDPNSSCNSRGDTALHLSARYCRPMVAHFLFSENKCNPNIKNQDGVTPLDLATDPEIISLLISSKRVQLKPGNVIFERVVTHSTNEQDSLCIDILKTLIEAGQWNPTLSCNSTGDTALHLSIRHHRPALTHFLLSQVKYEPNVTNLKGETPIQLIIQTCSDLYLINQIIATTSWDPNSICNCRGDTALHLSVLYYRPKLANFLVLEAGCSPNVKNQRGKTPIYLLLSVSQWKDSDCINLIKSVIATNCWDPNSACDSKGNTVLHLTALYHRPKVAEFMLSGRICDTNIKNAKGETPLQVLIITPVWSDSECISIIKLLITIKQWDPNSRYYSVGDVVTILHLCARYNRPDAAHFLVSETKCDPNIRNRRGETPLHLVMSTWSDSECFEIIRDIVETKQWDPNSKCNSKGDTALHLSVRHHKPRVTHFLLSETKCDLNIRNKVGETIIEQLMHYTNYSECVDIIKALVATKRWDPNSSCNSTGDTALHLSVRHHKLGVVHYLLSEAKCDPNSKNLIDETPLQLANDTDVINDLIRHGANPENVYRLHGKSVGLKKPLKPPVKVFIIGNSGVGKSTLTEALKIEASFNLLTRAFTTRRRVSDVDEKTAGIVPHDFESKNYGRVTFYDFAGHREFYSSHAAFLHNVIQASSPIFLVVVNMSTKNDTIQQNILYWLSFVENQCTVINCTTHVIVIGSHADIVLSGGDDPQQKATEISESITKIFQSSIVEYVAIHPMDCQYPESPGMTKLRQCLIEICNAVRIPEVITFNAHCFHVFILDKFGTSVAVTVQEIRNQIMKEQNVKEGIAKFLPDTSTTICKVCVELNNRGHILFLKNTDSTKNSWVIIDKALLLSEVTGTIFAPKNFKQHCQLAESTGVVPLSRLTKHFPGLRTEVLIGFMTHLEFCREILDSKLLELIMKHHESLNNADMFMSDSEHYFLFPGLITQKAPDNLWKQNYVFKYHYAWVLQCTRNNEFFSSRFLQVLLLRLAFSFALVKVEVDENIPAFQRECSIWKNGIFWGEIFGMEVIVEVHSNNKTVVFQSRCQKENLLHCIAQRSHIITKILQCVQDFCPQIKKVESFIDPSEATQFPIELSKIPRYTLQKIAEAIVNSNDCYMYPLSVVSSTQIIPLHHLVTFEPYAEIGLSMLKNMYSDHVNKLSDQALESLSCSLSKKYDLFSKIFGLTPHSLSTIPSSPTPEDLLTVLQQWRDGCEGTYKCLKEKLDQYSIFAGRNILVSSYKVYIFLQ